MIYSRHEIDDRLDGMQAHIDENAGIIDDLYQRTGFYKKDLADLSKKKGGYIRKKSKRMTKRKKRR